MDGAPQPVRRRLGKPNLGTSYAPLPKKEETPDPPPRGSRSLTVVGDGNLVLRLTGEKEDVSIRASSFVLRLTCSYFRDALPEGEAIQELAIEDCEPDAVHRMCEMLHGKFQQTDDETKYLDTRPADVDTNKYYECCDHMCELENTIDHYGCAEALALSCEALLMRFAVPRCANSVTFYDA